MTHSVSSTDLPAASPASPLLGGTMSAAQTQKESSEAGWGCLESLGLSQRELVLAEALQMEYDALSRLRQDKSGTGTSSTEPGAPGQTGMKTQNPSTERARPVPSQNLMDLSVSESSPNQPGGSQFPLPLPPRPAAPPVGFMKETPYILDSPEVSKFRDLSGSGQGDSFGPSLGLLSKGSTLPDDVPPAIPPRHPLPPPSGSELPLLPPRPSAAPRDVNLFQPDTDGSKVTSAQLNYDIINESLTRLNEGRLAPPAGRSNGDQSGKPVARSKTLPPQVPPRTYIPTVKSNKNQRRVSADPVRT